MTTSRLVGVPVAKSFKAPMSVHLAVDDTRDLGPATKRTAIAPIVPEMPVHIRPITRAINERLPVAEPSAVFEFVLNWLFICR
jgi:hypothetical protein